MRICHIVIYITRILITVFLILRDIFVNLLNRQICLCFECIIVNVFFLEVIFTCVWYFIYRWKSRYIQCIIIESLIVYYWSIILSTQFIIWRYLPGIMLWYLNSSIILIQSLINIWINKSWMINFLRNTSKIILIISRPVILKVFSKVAFQFNI